MKSDERHTTEMTDRYKPYPNTENGNENELLPPIKRVAALHDISCLGRCALTVIIPVLSALGLQTVPLPTALLSTHTGGFTDMFFEDLTGQMKKISRHWQDIDVDFDALYSGFLGSDAQIEVVADFTRKFGTKNDGTPAFVAVDPVMGDDGELYSTYTKELMLGMSRLCYGADLITPNLTEACFLLGKKYPTEMSADEADGFSRELCSMLHSSFGTKNTVVTGASGGDTIATAACDAHGKISVCRIKKLPLSYPGTGDVFASVLLGGLLSGENLFASSEKACAFVSYATEFSSRYKTPIRDGLVIEPCLSLLLS